MNDINMAYRTFYVLVIATMIFGRGISQEPAESSKASDTRERKIAFVAGGASHGYGEHEHYAGCAILARELTSVLPEYRADIHRNGWPADSSFFDGADCIVIFSDGGGGHPALQSLDFLKEKMNSGVGLVCLHYAVEVPKGEPGNAFLGMLGGYFETDWSVNPHWTLACDVLPSHAITRGVRKLKVQDEWYFHMRFPPEMQGVTPILSAVPPASTMERPDGPHSGNPAVRKEVAEGKSQHVAWAFERP